MKQVKAKDLASNAYLRLCCYGEPGTGKTWLGASAALHPSTAPVLFCDYRSQISSLRSNPKYLEAVNDGRLVILTLEKYEELNYVYTYLFTQDSPQSLCELFEKHGPPKTVVIDSITELQRLEVLRLGGNKLNVFLSEIEPPEIREWGTILNQFTLLVQLFYDLPLHVVVCGLEAVDYGRHAVGETAPISGYRIALQGKGQRQVPAYALTLMRLERAAQGTKTTAGNPVFSMGYTQAVRAKSKDQTGLLPAKIPDPSIPLLAKYLEGVK